MISWAALAAFVPVAAIVVAVPGPSVLFAVGRALSAGRRSGLLTVLGNCVGVAFQAVVVACGLGALLTSISWLLVVLKIVGGLYIIWLGVQAIRNRRRGAEFGSVDERPVLPSPRRSTVDDLRTGLVVGLSNPKTMVFFGALLPQFVPVGTQPIVQMLALGALFCAIGITGDSLWVLAAARARAFFQRPGQRAKLQATGGVLLVGLGAMTLAGY